MSAVWAWMYAIWTRPSEAMAAAAGSEQEPPVAEIVTLAVVVPSLLEFLVVRSVLGWWYGALSVLQDVVVAALSIGIQVPLLVLAGRRLGWNTSPGQVFRPYGLAWAINIPGVFLLDLGLGLGGPTGGIIVLGLVNLWYWSVLAKGVRAHAGVGPAQAWLAIAPVIVTDILFLAGLHLVDARLFPDPTAGSQAGA